MVGRFLSTDPITFQDGDPGTFNRYAYVNDSPYDHTDPTGMAQAQQDQEQQEPSKYKERTTGSNIPGHYQLSNGQLVSTPSASSGSGGTGGGQSDMAGLKTGSHSGMDVDKAVKHLDDNAGDCSKHSCAAYVRRAIEAGGVNLQRPDDGGKGYAKDYGPSLMDAGFEHLSSDNYSAQKGDVIIFQGSLVSEAGHMEMYNGSRFESDFKQNSKDVYPSNAYRNANVPYDVYRP